MDENKINVLELDNIKEEIRSMSAECCGLTKHEFEEQRKLCRKLEKGETLTKILQSRQLIPVETITFSSGSSIKETRLTEDMRYILRNIIRELKNLHAQELVHGKLSGDSIVLSERRYIYGTSSNQQLSITPRWGVKLVASSMITKGVKAETDVKDLSELIKKILSGSEYEFPKDVEHLLSQLDNKDNRIAGSTEIFVAYHPCTWTSNEVYTFVEKMRCEYHNSSYDAKKNIKAKVKKVQISNDWFRQLEVDPVFKKVHEDGKAQNQNYPPALQMLFFYGSSI